MPFAEESSANAFLIDFPEEIAVFRIIRRNENFVLKSIINNISGEYYIRRIIYQGNNMSGFELRFYHRLFYDST